MDIFILSLPGITFKVESCPGFFKEPKLYPLPLTYSKVYLPPYKAPSDQTGTHFPCVNHGIFFSTDCVCLSIQQVDPSQQVLFHTGSYEGVLERKNRITWFNINSSRTSRGHMVPMHNYLSSFCIKVH